MRKKLCLFISFMTILYLGACGSIFDNSAQTDCQKPIRECSVQKGDEVFLLECTDGTSIEFDRTSDKQEVTSRVRQCNDECWWIGYGEVCWGCCMTCVLEWGECTAECEEAPLTCYDQCIEPRTDRCFIKGCADQL